jgi:predicted RNA-binding Zn-ribbon protein involved in translation (DUF1610 family)
MTTERPIQRGAIILPGTVRQVGEFLIWREDLRRNPRQKRAGVALIDQFRQLHVASDEAILDFARRWGVLGICKHGLPTSHSPSCLPVAYWEGDTVYWKEPLSVWRKYSRCVGAVLNVAGEVAQERNGRAADWRILLHWSDEERLSERDVWPSPPGHLPLVRLRERGFQDGEIDEALIDKHARLLGLPWGSLSAAREMLGVYVNGWIRMSGMVPWLDWDGKLKVWRIDLVPSGYAFSSGLTLGLLGALALRLMLVVANSEGFALCASCHQSYFPKRRPDPTRRNYCPQCGKQAAWRDAARAVRERRRRKAAL